MEALSPRLQKRLISALMSQTPGWGADIRIIASSTMSLEQRVDEGKFSEELYGLLGTIHLRLPPLRARRDDIPFLLSTLMHKEAQRLGKAAPRPDSEALACLLAYGWPGNMNELKGLAFSLAAIESRVKFTPDDLPGSIRHAHGMNLADGQNLMPFLRSVKLPRDGIDLPGLMDTVERTLIEKALESGRGVKKEAARLLGLKRTTLIEKMKKKRI